MLKHAELWSGIRGVHRFKKAVRAMSHARGMIEFDGVTMVYPGAVMPSVDTLTMRVEAGEICSLVGPSGSGKSTVMRMINRLVEPTSGTVRIDGIDIRSMDIAPLRRSIGYVIPHAGLFPHRTVLDNIGTALRLIGWDSRRIAARSWELLDLVGLEPSTFRARIPSQLSPQERQLVSIARALAARPSVLLIDEPFGASDPMVREQIQESLLRMQRVLKMTIIIATNDVDGAMRISDKVAVLQEGGTLAQLASPALLLAEPSSDHVQRFIDGESPAQQLAVTRVHDLPLIPLDVAQAQGMGLVVDVHSPAMQWSNGIPIRTRIAIDAPLHEALDDLVAAREQRAPVVDAAGRPLGIVTTALLHGWLDRPIDAASGVDQHAAAGIDWHGAGERRRGLASA